LNGKYLSLSQTTDEEIRSLSNPFILTRKGFRYYLPDFGTRLFEYIFEPLDGETFETLKTEIEDSITTYIPNLTIQNISIEPYIEDQNSLDRVESQEFNEEIYRLPGANTQEYTAKVKIEYTNENNPFGSREFVIINI
jgi:phage baseplate assembly protein W